MELIFNKKNKILFNFLILLIILILGILGFYFKDSDEFLSNIILNIASGVFTSFVLAWIIFKFSPESFISNFEVIPAKQINKVLRENKTNAKEYFFKGAMGSWMRDNAILPLVDNAIKDKETLVLKIVLLDPRDEKSCSHYAYEKNNESKTSKWNVEEVQNHILATAFKIKKIAGHNSNIVLNIGLIKHFGAYRYDFTNNGGMLTQASKSEEGLFVPAPSTLYKSFKQEIIDSYEQSYKLEVLCGEEDKILLENIVSNLNLIITPDRKLRIIDLAMNYKSDYE